MYFNIASSVLRSIDIVKGEAAAETPIPVVHYGPGSIVWVTFVDPVGTPYGSPLNTTWAFLSALVYDLDCVSTGVGGAMSHALYKCTYGALVTTEPALVLRQARKNLGRPKVSVAARFHLGLTASIYHTQTVGAYRAPMSA